MAAMVRISPDISDEDFPRNLRKFKYVEKGYVFGYVSPITSLTCLPQPYSDEALKDIFNASRGVFTSCDCFTCSNTSRCTCRDLSEIYDLRGKTNFSAYSEVLPSWSPLELDLRSRNRAHSPLTSLEAWMSLNATRFGSTSPYFLHLTFR